MIRFPLALTFVLASLFAAGCAPAVYVPLKAEDSGTIRNTRVHAAIVQDEVAAAVERSNVAAAGGGGLLLALVDVAVESHRTSRANKLMEPVRKEVGDFDFRAQFGATLQKTALELSALKVTQAATTAKPLVISDPAALWKDVPEAAAGASAPGLRPGAGFPVRPPARGERGRGVPERLRYELSANFRSLTMVTVAALWTRNQKEPIYRGRYLYHTPPIGAFKELEESSQAWAANNGAALRAAMTQGIAETMKMLTLDLGTAGGTPTASPTPKLSILELSFPAYLAKDGNRYIVRIDGGALTSASSDERFTPDSMPSR